MSGYLGGCLDSGPYCSCSYNCNYNGAGKGKVIILAWADVSWLNSVINRGASGCAISKCAVRCKYINAKETLSQKVRLLDINN